VSEVKSRYVVFDMDGTLIDSMSTHSAVFAAILRTRFGLPVESSRAHYHATAGQPLDDQFRSAAASMSGVPVTDLIEDFWTGVGTEPAVLFPGTRELLDELRGRGKQLFVSSSCTTGVVRAKLASVDLTGRFELLLGAEYGHPRKTKGEDHFTEIAGHLRVPRDEFNRAAVMVGDAPHDVKVALEGGLTSIGLGHTEPQRARLNAAGADFVINEIGKLAALLL
jgi:phosphoglycolate phosphatase